MRNQRWPRNSKFTSWAPSIPIPHESATTRTVKAAVMHERMQQPGADRTAEVERVAVVAEAAERRGRPVADEELGQAQERDPDAREQRDHVDEQLEARPRARSAGTAAAACSTRAGGGAPGPPGAPPVHGLRSSGRLSRRPLPPSSRWPTSAPPRTWASETGPLVAESEISCFSASPMNVSIWPSSGISGIGSACSARMPLNVSRLGVANAGSSGGLLRRPAGSRTPCSGSPAPPGW